MTARATPGGKAPAKARLLLPALVQRNWERAWRQHPLPRVHRTTCAALAHAPWGRQPGRVASLATEALTQCAELKPSPSGRAGRRGRGGLGPTVQGGADEDPPRVAAPGRAGRACPTARLTPSTHAQLPRGAARPRHRGVPGGGAPQEHRRRGQEWGRGLSVQVCGESQIIPVFLLAHLAPNLHRREAGSELWHHRPPAVSQAQGCAACSATSTCAGVGSIGAGRGCAVDGDRAGCQDLLPYRTPTFSPASQPVSFLYPLVAFLLSELSQSLGCGGAGGSIGRQTALQSTWGG